MEGKGRNRSKERNKQERTKEKRKKRKENEKWKNFDDLPKETKTIISKLIYLIYCYYKKKVKSMTQMVFRRLSFYTPEETCGFWKVVKYV